MTRIKGQLTTADYLPIAEYNRLVRGLEKDGEYLWETYCWLSFCTACRASDVRTLRWKDILGKSTMTRIEQKTKKNRLIKFNRDVQEKNRIADYAATHLDPKQSAAWLAENRERWTKVIQQNNISPE